MIIGVVGLIGSGKGTIANHLINSYGYRTDSFAKTLKDICAVMFGWDRELVEGETLESRVWREQVDPWWSEKLGIENCTPRKILQLMGTNVLREHFNDDIWKITLESRMRWLGTNVVISDVRFQNEVEFIKGKGGILINVVRGDLPEWYETAARANNGDTVALDTMKHTYNNVHPSEWSLAGVKSDYALYNNSSIENLQRQVDVIMHHILQSKNS